MTVEILVFCGWGFSNQLEIVSETHFSCDTVDRELATHYFGSLQFPIILRTLKDNNKFYFLDHKYLQCCKSFCKLK